MRGTAISMLMAAGAMARSLPEVEDRAALAPVPTVASGFPVKLYNEALSSLSAKAVATPAAVRLLPDVPLSISPEGIVHDVTPPTVRSAPITDTVQAPAEGMEKRQSSTCSNPTVFYEWRNLSDQHKQQWSSAMQCLLHLGSRSGLPGCQNRWDDFAAIHQHMSPQIHDDGQFAPWHRYFLWMLRQELSRYCGYNGPMTWWDETKDAGHFQEAPMFTPQYLGHAPDGNGVCITTGVFASTTLHIGPGTSNTNHCLARGVNEQTSSQITQSYINLCWSYTDYNQMQECLFYGVHALGHNAIGGGVMNDIYSSPGDPAFFLHHHFIDHCWRLWENQNAARLSEIDGYTNSPCEDGTQHSGCTTTNLNYQLTSYNFYPAVSVSQVMNTESTLLCYKYDY